MGIDFRLYLDQAVNWLIRSGPRIVVILVLMFVGVRLSRIAAARIFAVLGRRRKMDEEYRKRADTLRAVVAYAIGATVVMVAALMILAELNIQIGPMLAAAGVVGVAAGFGAQHLVQDVISGFFILLDDEIRVDDVVETAGKSGLVERLNLRMVVLRDLAGSVHYVRNGKIDIVTNMTKDNRRLKQKFDERNIEIPFPHVTLSIAQDKAGRAAPLPVVVLERPEAGGGKTGDPSDK